MPGLARRPLIAVTTYRQETRWWSWDRDAAVVPGVYLDMVVAAGGWPVLVPPVGADIAAPVDTLASATASVLDAVDGLLVIGGGDVSAGRYGAEPDARESGVSDRRDELELELLDGALERDLPVLAVCRGLQVLNVLSGGTLVRHLPDVVDSTRHQPGVGLFGEVTVMTEPSTQIRRLVGERTDVRCSHHQAVDRLGTSLLVTARSDDGVVEAVEVLGRTFAVGVQWHPEEDGDVRLFAGLVDAARARLAHEGRPTVPTAD